MSHNMQKARILIVDDVQINLKSLAQILRSDYEISVATSGKRALEVVTTERPDLVLLDVMMPEMDGYAVCRQLKSRQETCGIPVIFVTSNRDATDETYALGLGAVDFISKPVVPSVVHARVKTHLGLVRARGQLVEAEKQAALGQLVAGVAHAMNTPVGIGVTAASELEERTRHFTRLLHGHGITEEELQEYISSTERLTRLIRDSLERASDLVRNFKQVAVDQSDEKLQFFRIKECLTSTVMTVCHELEQPQLTVTVSCPESLIIQSYPGILSQTIITLLHHSQRYSFQPGETGHVILEVADEGETVQISYHDDGRGMPAEVCTHIFDPFYTTWLDHGNGGLEMHIVYNLVARILEGTIACDATLGRGVHFLLRLPLHRPVA